MSVKGSIIDALKEENFKLAEKVKHFERKCLPFMKLQKTS